MYKTSTVAAAIAAWARLASTQTVDSSVPNNHPSLPTWKCTTSGGCVEQDTSVVVDWNYYWIHTASDVSCTTSSGVNATLCPNEATCAANCEITPGNYTAQGVTTSGDALTMYQYENGQNASPRLYLLGSDGDYEMLQLLGQELSFTVDASNLPCGENGALYLSQMDKTGGRSQYNPGGAEFGSGYCDAQCPVQTWRNGTLNTSGEGYCCNEMDILEGNSEANAFTPHPCSSSACDSDGCGFNSYAQGFHNYYGPGGTVDTTKPFTIITQFITDDGTTTGTLSQITRKYIQNGIELPPAVSGGDSITESWCTQNDGAAATYGGLTTMGDALSDGMVLVFSIWNDAGQFMNWLDSGNSGPCSSTAGNPTTIQANDPTTHVIFSNIRWGDIGSTTSGTTGPPGGGSSSSSSTKPMSTSHSTSHTTAQSTTSIKTTSVKTTSTLVTTVAPTGGPTQTHWGQCGGSYYTGPTSCATPYSCQTQNPYYAQCL